MFFKVKQRGAKDTKWRHERLTQAVTFYARTLRIPNAKHLDVTLKLSSSKVLVEGDVAGECIAVSGYLNDAPTKYEITIQRDMPWSWTLKTFAHEMVHVHQWATKRLRRKWDSDLSTWVSSWENGPWVDKKTIPYASRPWEIEARAKEEGLLEAFFKAEQVTGTYYYGS